MILVVEDKKDSRSSVSALLKKAEFDVDMTGDIEKAMKLIKDQDIRILIIDSKIKSGKGILLCEQVRQTRFKRYVYIIIINSSAGKEAISEVYNAGADDYVSDMNSNREELVPRVKVAMRMSEIEDKLIQTRKELIRVAKEDPLTGLLNRRAFLDETISEMERASREHHIISSIMIEIDNFKGLVESHGFEARDAMLVELAVRLQSSCRSYDKVAHFGGGIFMAALPNTRIKTAIKITKRMQSEITSRTFYLLGESVNISACFGVSLLAPDLGLKDTQLDDLLQKTQQALSGAKKQGINKIAVSAEK